MSYHKSKITKGILGEFSKIKEEFEELEDANLQKNPVLEICEMCDLIGAIELYASKFSLTLEDLIKMKCSTENAFKSGSRSYGDKGFVSVDSIMDKGPTSSAHI